MVTGGDRAKQAHRGPRTRALVSACRVFLVTAPADCIQSRTISAIREQSMGKRMAAKITGVAGYVPPRVVTNADIEKFVDTNDEWIRTRTGILERHYAEPGVASSHLGAEAAKRLLASKGVSPDEIEMIVVATVTPDMLFPSTACLIQDRLGAKQAWGFDLSAACSGFIYALTACAQFVAAGTHKKALVIGSDIMTSILDFKDRATCVLFGD